LLDPRPIDLDQVFAREFRGMTAEPADLADLIATRVRLIEDIKSRLDEGAMRFLLSLHDANPDFSAISMPQAADLPAVRWKLQNLEQLIAQNPAKHAAQRQALEDVFNQ
jgi:hypothetical protein